MGGTAVGLADDLRFISLTKTASFNVPFRLFLYPLQFKLRFVDCFPRKISRPDEDRSLAWNWNPYEEFCSS